MDSLKSLKISKLVSKIFQLQALDNKGFIYSWGSNTFGQLGDGTNETRPTPGFVDTTGSLRNKKIVQIFAGYHHNLAIDADGFLYAWGRFFFVFFSCFCKKRIEKYLKRNDEGQLGDQTFEQRNTPVFCYTEGILKAKTIAAIAAGFSIFFKKIPKNSQKIHKKSQKIHKKF